MKKKNYLDYLILLITALYTSFSYIKIISSYINIHLLYLMLMCILILLKLAQKEFKIKISYIDTLWFAYLIFLCINEILITNYKSNGLQYLAYNIIIYCIYLCIKSSKNIEYKGLNLFYIFSGIHVVFIILQFLFPSFIMKINSVILQTSAYNINAYAMSNNYYSGITIQPASAGLFSTIFVIMAFIKLIVGQENKRKIIIQLLFGILALLLTQKRAFLLATIMGVIFIYVFYNPNKRKNKILKILKISIIIAIIISLMLIFIPQTRKIVQRFFKSENLLSGREKFYGEMLEWFSRNVGCGIGIGTADALFGYGGHNIYLQTLAETGIIGFVLLYIVLILIFIKNLRISNELISKINKKEQQIILYSLYMQIILFIYGMTGNPIYDYTFFVIFVMAMALPPVIRRKTKNEKNC